MDERTGQQVGNPAPVFDLDLEKVGSVLVRLAASSSQLGHARPEFSARDYVQRDQLSREGQFVVDVLTRRTAEIAREWFGSEMDARAFATYGLALRHANLREDGSDAA